MEENQRFGGPFTLRILNAHAARSPIRRPIRNCQKAKGLATREDMVRTWENRGQGREERSGPVARQPSRTRTPPGVGTPLRA